MLVGCGASLAKGYMFKLSQLHSIPLWIAADGVVDCLNFTVLCKWDILFGTHRNVRK